MPPPRPPLSGRRRAAEVSGRTSRPPLPSPRRVYGLLAGVLLNVFHARTCASHSGSLVFVFGFTYSGPRLFPWTFFHETPRRSVHRVRADETEHARVTRVKTNAMTKSNTTVKYRDVPPLRNARAPYDVTYDGTQWLEMCVVSDDSLTTMVDIISECFTT